MDSLSWHITHVQDIQKAEDARSSVNVQVPLRYPLPLMMKRSGMSSIPPNTHKVWPKIDEALKTSMDSLVQHRLCRPNPFSAYRVFIRKGERRSGF